jgi:hypothetical protein
MLVELESVETNVINLGVESMNIFEGSRRISKLILGSIVVVYIYTVITETPQLSIKYNISFPNDPYVRVESDCSSDDYSEYITRTTKKGNIVSVTLCFLASESTDGSKVIPFKIDRNTREWWGNAKYSTDVNEYTSRVSSNFKIPEGDEKYIDDQWWRVWFKDIKSGFVTTIECLIGFWFFTLVVGWIVRGFMGIPSGQDTKPPKDS